MSLTVDYLSDALAALNAIEHQFESRNVGAGAAWTQAVYDQIDAIARQPTMYAEFRPGMRAAPVPCYNYVVYFRFENGVVTILTVRHAHRPPPAFRP